MLILGMESSCDETSCAVVEMSGGQGDAPCVGKIRSNIVASQIDIHRLYGGVVPEIAGRAHIEAVSRITREALDTAGVTIKDIEAIAVTTHPGLIGALLVGVNFAKSLAYANGIPLLSVNHINAHAAATYFEEVTPKPPFLALIVSGGHTSIYKVDNYTDFEVIGQTRDDAAGEAFDKVGRVIGLSYPAGAEFDALAYKGDNTRYKLPSPAIGGDTLDFSFSGLKTAALNLINSASQKGEKINEADLAASYTKAVIDGITQKTASALHKTGYKTLVMSGGVAANTHIRSALTALCEREGVRFITPSRSLCGDNGAMVAAAGYFEYLAGRFSDVYLNASASD